VDLPLSSTFFFIQSILVVRQLDVNAKSPTRVVHKTNWYPRTAKRLYMQRWVEEQQRYLCGEAEDGHNKAFDSGVKWATNFSGNATTNFGETATKWYIAQRMSAI
jgi:hypothetical protein